MGLRLIVSRLAAADTRAAAARGLAVLCAIGFALTMVVVMAARGGLDQWFFVLLVWTLFVYVPLRILLEAAQTLAPALRARLVAEASGQPARYGSRSRIELMVDGLFERDVVMPRITTPVHASKAKDGAAAVLVRTQALHADLGRAASDCLACVDRWIAHLGVRAATDPGQSIQARWGEVRALAALAAATRVLIAAYEDQAGTRFGAGDGQLADPEAFLEACLDYCDDLALDVEIPPWTEPPLHLPLPSGRAEAIRTAWKAFVDVGAPALEMRASFVEILLEGTLRPDEHQPPLHERRRL